MNSTISNPLNSLASCLRTVSPLALTRHLLWLKSVCSMSGVRLCAWYVRPPHAVNAAWQLSSLRKTPAYSPAQIVTTHMQPTVAAYQYAHPAHTRSPPVSSVLTVQLHAIPAPPTSLVSVVWVASTCTTAVAWQHAPPTTTPTTFRRHAKGVLEGVSPVYHQLPA